MRIRPMSKEAITRYEFQNNRGNYFQVFFRKDQPLMALTSDSPFIFTLVKKQKIKEEQEIKLKTIMN